MNFAEFHFLRPWWLLALLPAVALLFALLKHQRSRGDWATVCDVELLPFILQDKPAPSGRSGLIAAGLVAVLSILALAGPSWQRLPSPAFRNDAALVIALDLSKSMDATDIKPSRISRARFKITDILKQRKDGQTALLVYGGDAFTVTPLTSDIATITSQLEALTTDIMPSPGSNTTQALEKAVALLRQAGLAQGHILLVTDSVDSDSAAQAGSVLGDYRLSILAVGSEEGAPVPSGRGGFLQDNKGGIVLAKLDLAALTALASSGHGLLQTVSADDQDIARLAAVFNDTVPGETQQNSDKWVQQWEDQGPWLLFLVLPWAALRFRKGLLSLALWLLLPLPQDAQALDWQSLWQNADQRAQQAFAQQQFEQAAEQFRDPDWRAAAQYKAGQYQQAAETLKNTQTAEGHYNRGNALAKAGQLQEAVQAYQQALALNPEHADAQYNKALVEKQLQEQDQQQDQNQPQDQGQKQQEQQKSDQSNPSDQQQQKQQQGDTDQAKPAQKSAQDKPQPAEKENKQDEAQNNAEQSAKPAPQDKAEPAQSAASEKADADTERANQQLLKRIPDEPTGLLKRKFKYQYGQRRQAAPTGPAW